MYIYIFRTCGNRNGNIQYIPILEPLLGHRFPCLLMQPILGHVRHETRNPKVQNVSCFNVQERKAFDTNIEHGPSSTPEKISDPLRIQCGRVTAIALIMHQRIHHNSEMFLQGHLLNIVEICWTFVQVCPVSTIVYRIFPKEKNIKVDYQTKL